MKKGLVKKVLLGVLALALVLLLAGGGFVLFQVRAFDASANRVYDAPLSPVKITDDAAVLARGKHIAESLGGCTASECHGADLAGGKVLSMGPVGTIAGPNITPGGVLATYSDAELHRLVKLGIKRDGRSVLMMPVPDFYWMPDDDVTALVSYLRTVKSSTKQVTEKTSVGIVGKVLDRQGKFPWDIARAVASLPKAAPPDPEPSEAYGKYVVRLCTGCHGETLSGGPLPGAPPEIPIPLNITPHETGIKDYTFEDFQRVLRTGIRKNGEKLDPFMAVDLTRNLNDVEMRALWSALRSVPPKPFGDR